MDLLPTIPIINIRVFLKITSFGLFPLSTRANVLKRCCWMALFHHNETQLSLSETSHYPFLPRFLLLCISRLNGFTLSLYMEFLTCSIQSLSTWEQFKSILLKKKSFMVSSDVKSIGLSCTRVFQTDLQESLKAPPPTQHHPLQASSSCPSTLSPLLIFTPVL